MKRLLLVFGLVLAMAIPALAADSTSLFNEKVLGTKIEKASGGGGVPVGTVIAWPANSNPEDPENWLECNGQGISHSVYPELFAVVGGSVPDFRGLFLRGVGGNSASLGITQNYEIQKHSHGIMTMASVNMGGAEVPPLDAAGNWAEYQTKETGGSETRPVNKAVRYLIRATP